MEGNIPTTLVISSIQTLRRTGHGTSLIGDLFVVDPRQNPWGLNQEAHRRNPTSPRLGYRRQKNQDCFRWGCQIWNGDPLRRPSCRGSQGEIGKGVLDVP